MLFSQSQKMPIQFFEGFNRQAIKESIINHLNNNTRDTLEFCREYDNYKRNYGMEIIDFYGINPKNNKPSKIILKGDREYFRSL